MTSKPGYKLADQALPPNDIAKTPGKPKRNVVSENKNELCREGEEWEGLSR